MNSGFVLVALALVLASCTADHVEPVAEHDADRVILNEDTVVLSNGTLDTIRSFVPAQAPQNGSLENGSFDDSFLLTFVFEGTPDGSGMVLLTRGSSEVPVEVTSSSVFSIVRSDVVSFEVSEVTIGSQVYRSSYESSQFLMNGPKTFTITYEPVS